MAYKSGFLIFGVGSPIVLATLWLISFSGGFELDDGTSGWFYEYQTIIAGILALSGAVVTILYMYSNHRDLVHRRDLAARAYMHDAASEICGYCQEMFNGFWQGNEPISDKPNESIKALKDNIGYVDIQVAEKISIILSRYQVFHSRLGSCLYSGVPSDKELRIRAERISEILEIYALTAELFSYARKKPIEEKMLNDNVYSTLNIMMGKLRGFGLVYDDHSSPIHKEVTILIDENFPPEV